MVAFGGVDQASSKEVVPLTVQFCSFILHDGIHPSLTHPSPLAFVCSLVHLRSSRTRPGPTRPSTCHCAAVRHSPIIYFLMYVAIGQAPPALRLYPSCVSWCPGSFSRKCAVYQSACGCDIFPKFGVPLSSHRHPCAMHVFRRMDFLDLR